MYTSHINLLMDRNLTYHNMSYQILMEAIEDFDQVVARDHAEEAKSFACVNDDDQQQPEQISRKKKKKKKGSKKSTRRFSDEQVRSLESMFESETRLEPRKKMQLARELGLQPRQVAIWFQNRRARWKTKQMEQKYKTLKDNYDNLASSYESLKNERESLLLQLQTVSDLLGNPCEGLERRDRSIDAVLRDGITNFEAEAQHGLDNSTIIAKMCDEMSMENGHSGDQGQGFLNRSSSEYSDGTLASNYEKWFNPDDSGGQFDLSWSSSYWFNFRT